MASHFHLIVVGKLKNRHIEALEEDYLKRLKMPLRIHEVKSHGDDIKREEAEIKSKIQSLNKSIKPCLVLLSEHGKLMKSSVFADFIEKQKHQAAETIFIIGGSLGFQKSFFTQTQNQISLSPMILPHKLARLFFIEQFYRAETILNGHPYSH